MRVEFWLMALAASGCAVDLEDTPAPESQPPAPTLASCKLFEQLDGLKGRVTPVTLPDGRELTLAAHPDLEGDTSSAAFEGTERCGAEAVPFGARPVIDVSAHGDGWTATPRASFTTDEAFVYFSLDRGFESQGAGIARYDPDAEAFVSEGLLWTSDRPSYGSGALVDGDYVYVYGGAPARFLAADVYLARVARDRVSEPNAYEYFQGGGSWATDPDLAGALLEGGTQPSVMWHAASERYLMAYATPLAREITLRSGLGAAGPWSRPFTFGSCALPFEQAFCGDLEFLPAFATKGALALGQGVVAIDPPADADERDYWTRLVSGDLPDLP